MTTACFEKISLFSTNVEKMDLSASNSREKAECGKSVAFSRSLGKCGRPPPLRPPAACDICRPISREKGGRGCGLRQRSNNRFICQAAAFLLFFLFLVFISFAGGCGKGTEICKSQMHFRRRGQRRRGGTSNCQARKDSCTCTDSYIHLRRRRRF